MDNMQKIKLLKLWELLEKETAEDRPLKTNELCKRLRDMGITVDRRTLSKDMDVLNEAGFEVMSRFVGHEKAYYVADRSFSVPEVKLLMDAVQSAVFITPSKTQALMKKVADLGGQYQAELLSCNATQFNTRKYSNESIYYAIDSLEHAILTGHQASFRYFKLDENHQRAYRRNGEPYCVEPIALVYREDFYYLCCYDHKYRHITNYRVDRMDRVEALNTPISQEAVDAKKNFPNYTDTLFKMYAGEETAVKLCFHDEVMSSVYDRFGESVQMERVDEEHCTATVHVQISEAFWGWLFQYGNYIKILSPAWVADAYREQLKCTLDFMKE